MSRHGARDAGKGGRRTVDDRQRWRTRPTMMALEERTLLSTFTVTSVADSAPAASPAVNTLRWAVEQANDANSASSIEIELGTLPATITLTQGALTLSNTMYATKIYDGPGEGPVTISGNNASQVIEVEASVTGSISGLTISDGSAAGNGGGLYNYGGTVMLTDCAVSGNSASGNGGGLYTCGYGTTSLTDCTISGNFTSGNGGGVASSLGTTTMTGCTVSDNSASGSGGGVLNFFGTTALSDCTISGNSAGANGGGLYDFVGTTILNDGNFSGNDADNGGGLFDFFGTGTLANCSFSGNTAALSGAGLYSNGSYLTLTYGSFSDNSAALNGGGLYNNGGGTVTLDDGSFSGNFAGDNGGGVDNMSATTTLIGVTVSGNSASHGGGLADFGGTTGLTNCAISGNSGTYGGGLYNFNGTTALTNVSVSGNFASTGGGLCNEGGSATLTNSSVTGNSAISGGGGVYNDLGTATLVNCSVSDNDASTGGGVGNDNHGTTTLTNCTVSGNSASANGGGVDNGSAGTSALTNCTVSGNSAGVEGGGIDNESGVVSIGNTIVAANTGTDTGPDAVGIFASLGNNLIEEVDGSSGWVDSDLIGTEAHPLDALLAPLGNYGGSTQTMALLPGSPAIDAGNNALIPAGVTTDQRGLPRIVNGVVDIGAFESSGFTIAVTSGSDQSADVLTAFSAPLVATVTANNPSEPVAGGLVAFTSPQSGPSATLTGNPATISANGTVSVGATANAIGGNYTVMATANGISDSASFSLTNKWVPTFSVRSQTIEYGTATTTLSGELGDGSAYPSGSSVEITLDSVTQTAPIDNSGDFTTTFNTASLGVAGGPYTVTYTFAGNSAFASAIDTSTQVTVTPAPLTITASGVSQVYGGSDPSVRVTYSGFVNDETPSVLGGTLSLVNTDAAPTTSVGSYSGAIVASGLTSTNYTITYIGGTLTVTPAPLTITASGVSRVYGASDPALGLTYSGFVNGETSSVLGGALSVVDSDAAPTTGVGSYAGVITASGLTATNYTITYVAGNLTVTPAPLTITANGVSRVYGASDPALGVTYSGFVNGETSSVLGGVLSVVDSDAASTTAVGSYAGVITASGLTSTNYTISYVNGSLTVNPAPLTITANSTTKTYGQTVTLAGGAFSTSGLVNSDSVSSVSLSSTGAAATATVNGSPYAIVASNAVGSGLGNYTISYVNGSLTVTPAPLTITANSTTKTYGQTVTLAGGAFSTSGLVNSDSVSSVSLSSTGAAATATVSGSPYAIVASGAVGSGLGNYTISYVAGNLTVTPAPLTITANSTTKTYGQTMTFAGTSFSTSGLLNSDSVSSVSLSSTGAAATATVSGSPYAIVASGAVGSGLGNYTISYANGSLTVNPAPLTITADSMTKTYGQTVTFAGGTFSTSGLLDSDSVSSVSLSSTGATATAAVNGSPYAIVVSNAVGSGLGNYAISYVNGSLTVIKTSPTITTVPNTTVVAMGTATTLTDTATLSGGYGETGTINFTLYAPNGSTVLDTQTVTVSGNGIYSAPNYGLSASAAAGVYQWDATYNGDGNNGVATDTNDASEQVWVVNPCCNLTGITYSVYNPSTGVTTTPTDLRGNTAQGDTVSATFTVPTGDYDQLSLVSYTAPESSYYADDADLQVVHQSITEVYGPGTHTIGPVTLPNSFYQVDFVCGSVIATLGVNSSDTYSAQSRLISADNEGVNPVGSGVLSVSGEVYSDQNADGKLDSGDPGLANVTVTLTGTDAYGNFVSETQTTDGAGNYAFSGLPFSDSAGYAVSVSPPAGDSAGEATVGTVSGVADGILTSSPEGVHSIVLGSPSQTTAIGYNLGLLTPSGSGCNSAPVSGGEFATIGFWRNSNGKAVIDSFNGGSTATALGTWLATKFPNLFGSAKDPVGNLAGDTNAQVASLYASLPNNGVTNNDYIQAFAVALGVYADTTSLAGSSTLATKYGFTVSSAGFGSATYNVRSNGAACGVANNSNEAVISILQAINSDYSPTARTFYGGSSTLCSEANTVLNGINTTGDVASAVSLAAPAGAVAYTPAQIRAGYDISSLSLDGTGETIAIVDAYDDPNIFQTVDAFDVQFGLTDSGPTLANQYGPASSFLTVLNQNGQSTSLPETDPSGPGNANWEVEEALDVEWAHAIAPGAQIVLVEANSQSLSDLMTAVATAASQPGVSVVSMSWGFQEGQAVFASDEATYDSVFSVPGVTFVASTGDYGAADPEYPAFSPNVVAVGGTSLTLNGDDSYNSETGWGYQSDSIGAFIGSGGGISLYEPEPAYQQGVQSLGSRTTPDVSFVADPATGAWIADTYNLGMDNPFEVVGGTSLSTPTWAGLLALVNEGRAITGEATLDSTGPTETQQALYSLPQSDYNVISSGFNGYTADAGYNLVTGLGTPVANLLVGDLVEYQGPGTVYFGPTVGALQDATLVSTGSGGGGTSDAFTVFSAITMSNSSLGYGQGSGVASATGTTINGMPAQSAVASHATLTPFTAPGSTVAMTPSSLPQTETVAALGRASAFTPFGTASPLLAALTITPVHAGFGSQLAASSTRQAFVSLSDEVVEPTGSATSSPEVVDQYIPSWRQTGPVADADLDELAADPCMWPSQLGDVTIMLPVLPTDRHAGGRVIGGPMTNKNDRSQPLADYTAGLAFLGLAAGFWARGTGLIDGRKRRRGQAFFMRKPM